MATQAAPLKRDGAGRLDLQRHRKARGLSLEQIAEDTKISIRFLRAIEASEFSQLPGGIFATSYLRQYASQIGFDESRLIEYYERAIAKPERCGAGEESSNRSFLQRLGIVA